MKRFFIAIMLIFSYSTVFPTVGVIDSGTFGSSGITTTAFNTLDLAYATAVQPDGKILVAGSTNTNTTDFALARYGIDGTLDASFGTGGKVTTNMGGADVVYAVAIQNDGKIVAAGTKGNGDFALTRYNADGTLDTSFDTDGKLAFTVGTTGAIAYAIAIQPADGKILVAGVVDANKIVIARLNSADGSFDTSFNTAGAGGDAPNTAGMFVKAIGTATVIYAMALQSDGKIVLAGSSDGDVIVARILSTGLNFDTAGFNTATGYIIQDLGGTDVAYGVGIQSTGKIVICGTNGTNAAVARFTAAGLLDTFALSGASCFGAGAPGAGTGINSWVYGYTTAIAYGMVIDPNDKIVLAVTGSQGGSTKDDFIISRYLADGSALDTLFNPATGFTTTDIAFGGANSIDTCHAIAMQPNGKFVLAGSTVNGGNTDIAVVRYLGDATPQGCIDVNYDPADADGDNGFSIYPTVLTSVDKPQVKAICNGSAADTLLVLTESLAGTPKTQIVQLASNGSITSAGAVTKVDVGTFKVGGSDIILDGKGRALAVGTDSGHGWMARYTITPGAPGSFTFDATFNSNLILVETSRSTKFSRVGEQATGRIIVMGQTNADADAILVAYNPDGTIDTTFGTSGVYTLAGKIFSDMVIGSDNGIYVTYKGAANIEIRKIKADGSGFFAGYASGAAIDTALANGTHAVAHLTFNNLNQLILGSADTSGNIVFKQYNNTDGTAGSTLTVSQAIYNLSNPVLTQIQSDTDSNGRVLYAGYDDNHLFVGRLSAGFGRDISFASYSTTPGMLLANYDDTNPTDEINGSAGTTPHRVLNAIAIGAAGEIYAGGYENIDATHTVSLVTNIVGDTTPYTQVARFPGSHIGQIDTTFGTSGDLPLSSIFATAGDTPAAMYVYDSGPLVGKILVAVTSGANTKIARLNSDYSLDSAAFNAAAGFGGTAGIMTFTGLSNPTVINVDLDGEILLSAGTSGSGSDSGILKNIASDGSAVNWTKSGSAMIDCMVGVLEQSSSRIIGYGAEDGAGTLIAFNPVDGSVDTFFGNSGRFNASLGTIVASAAIDSNNNILVAYRSGATVQVKRIKPNGYALDTFSTITFTPPVGFAVDTDIRIALDKDQKIIVVARNSTGHFYAQRYLSTGVSDVGPVTITLASPGTSVLSSILTLSSSDTNVNGSTLVMGYNTGTTKLIAARILPDFSGLDTNFATAGLLEATVSTMDTFKAIDVTSDKGIIIAGHDTGTGKPALTRLYDDYVVTKVDQDPSTEVGPGIRDVTFGTSGIVNMHTDLSTTQFATPSQAKRIVNATDGSYFVAADDGANTYISKFYGPSNLLDDTQVTTFGTAGVVTISGLFNVADMFIDQSGALLVCGGSGAFDSEAGWVQRYSSSVGTLDGTFTIAAEDNLDACTMVRQQKSGRILVAGLANNLGTVIAYNSITGAIDTSFGNGTGQYTLTSAPAINSMKIDGSDNIYVIANDNSNNATTYKINAEGTAQLWVGSTTVSNSTINSNNHIVLDQSGIPVIVAVNTTTNHVVMRRYNTATGVQAATLDIASFTAPAVTSMVVDTSGKFIFTANDGTTTTDVVRVLADLSALDAAGPDAFNGTGIQAHTISAGQIAAWNDLVITQEGKVDVVGFVHAGGTTDTPYMMRLFGDEFIAQFITPVTLGAPGVIDANFGTAGAVNLSAIEASLVNTSAQAVLALTNGKYLVAFDDTTTHVSQLAKFTQVNALDNLYSSVNLDGYADPAPQGVHAMFVDGQGSFVLTGTDQTGTGWAKRYLATGVTDATFGTAGLVNFPAGTIATVAIEQTLQRLIVAGKHGNGVLRAYKPNGVLDTTFNSLGSTPGEYSTGYAYGIWTLACDQYDRLYIAYQRDGSNIDLARLNSNGVLDTTFGTNGIVSGIITNPDNETQIRLALDSSGNIIVAAHFNDGANKIAVRGFDATGVSLYSELDITTLTGPALSDLKTTADGKVLVVGYESGNNDMWVARIKSDGSLDTTTPFGTAGFMTFHIAVGAQTARVLNALSVRFDGRISLVGYELTGGIKTAFIARAYNNPYVIEVVESPDSKSIGGNDVTFGVAGNNGISFFASSTTDAADSQIARAIALQGNNRIVVALDGTDDEINSDSRVFVTAFNIDGLLDATFNTTGQITVPHVYKNEYVNDMIVFSQDGVWKAILAGYATSGTPLSATNSWLMQFKLLASPVVDSTFGGLFQDGSGTAFGDIQELYTVGRQSTGRIIAGGLDYDGTTGSLVGYSSTGLLDNSFGSGGRYASASGTGIYAQVIDNKDRVLIAYNDGGTNRVAVTRILADGSGPDLTFAAAGGTPGTIAVADRITGISGNTNLRIAIDQNNKIIVAAVNNSGADYDFKRYNTDGTLDVSFTVTGGVLLAGVTSATIGRLLVDVDGKPVLVGSVIDGGGQWMIVVRLTATLSGLDTGLFNTAGTPGYLKYKVDAAKATRLATHGVIHNDGRILGIGKEN